MGELALTMANIPESPAGSNCARGHSQSLCHGTLLSSSNHSDRPSSSYSKTRDGYDANSTTQQFNLTPVARNGTQLETLHNNIIIPADLEPCTPPNVNAMETVDVAGTIRSPLFP